MNYLVTIDKDNIEKFSGLFIGDITTNYNDNSICYGMLANDEKGRNIPVALLMADFVKRDLLITWMYVAAPYRNQYIMTELLNKLINNARKTKIINAISCAVTDEDIAMYLLTQFGFSYDSYTNMGVMTSTIGSLKDLNIHLKDKNPAIHLKDVSENIMNKMNKFFMMNRDITVGVKLPIKQKDYSDLSMAVIQNNEIAALVLINEDDDDLIVSYAFAKEKCGHLLMYIVAALYNEFSEFPSDKKVIAATLNSQSEGLFTKLFSDYSINRLYECEYYL